MESLIFWMGLIITLIINFLSQYTESKSRKIDEERFERQIYKRRRVKAIGEKVNGTPKDPLRKQPEVAKMKPTDYTVSEVTEKELAFFNTLAKDIYDQGSIEEDEAILSVDDLNELEQSPPAYEFFEEEALLDQKIADEKLGMQIWRVSVVGMEGHYLHVYDGTKTWIKVDYIQQYKQHDIIDVVVNRTPSDIEVIKVQDVYRVSNDYVIPDEYTG